MDKFEVCKYPMNEAELAAVMEKYGFRKVTTGYVLMDLTPDNPKYSKEMAYQIINTGRYASLERIQQYETGEKQWDTDVLLTMVIRGIK